METATMVSIAIAAFALGGFALVPLLHGLRDQLKQSRWQYYDSLADAVYWERRAEEFRPYSRAARWLESEGKHQ